jgi:hypothetical protein
VTDWADEPAVTEWADEGDTDWPRRASTYARVAVADRVAVAGSPELARDALLAETRALLDALEAAALSLAENLRAGGTAAYGIAYDTTVQEDAGDLVAMLRGTRAFLDKAAAGGWDELALHSSWTVYGWTEIEARTYSPWAELLLIQGLLDALRSVAKGPGTPPRLRPGPTYGVAYDAAVHATSSAIDVIDGAAVNVPTASARTRALAAMPSAVAMETTLARLPLWAESRQLATQLELWAAGSLYRHPVRIVQAAGPMDDRAYRLLAHLIRRYAGAECPPERRVPFTLSEAARWAGYGKGGRQLRLVRDSLLRMRATALESAVRYPDGHTETLTWGLIDRGWTTDAVGRSGGFVTLSEELAGLIRQGSLVYLDAPMLDALGELDGMAVILWGFLEGETSRDWRHALFSAPEGYPPVDRETPAIADLLRVSGWDRRRRAKDRIVKACAAVMAVDPRYRLAITRGQGRGMWTLAVAKGPGTPRGARWVLSGALAGTPGGASGYSQGRGRAQNGGVPLVSTVGSNVSSLPSRENRSKDRHRDAILEAERQGRPDVAAYLDCSGFSRLTPKVLQLLDDIAARHDVTGYAWAADRIWEAPVTTARPGDDVYRYLSEADAAYRAPRLEAADAADRDAEARHRAAQARPRTGAPPALIGDVLPTAAATIAPELAGSLRPSVAPPPDPATLERRRADAISWLRAGDVTGTVAARLMADYGITPEELA